MRIQTGFVIRKIAKGFGQTTVLSDISCHIYPGTRWGILGPSGSGKSTLLRLIAGLEPPDTGEIYLDGRLLSRGRHIMIPARQRRISMVFQDLALWPNLTALENISLGLRNKKDAKERALKSLAMCGIAELSNRYPAELSGGEQQRLALARALALRPDYFFLDEPFSGLDLEIKNSIMDKIKALTGEHDITSVLVSHDPLEVFKLCKRVIVLQGGKILEVGEFDKLIKDSRSPLLEAFREYLGVMGSTVPK